MARFGPAGAALRRPAGGDALARNVGELTAPGVSKGAALAQLAAHMGIAREDVIAIGDHENDLPMIAWAGLGLAMGNAIPQAQIIADAVDPSVDACGVAWAIERLILKG